ncbi:MAG: cupin domain-containing protein [Betaproteobacteria bacterium]
MSKHLLGGLNATTFLRRHWQKQPLLVRGAFPAFEGVLDLDEMQELACREECDARLVLRQGQRWSVEHGPFSRKRLSRLPARDWTLLVQGLERVLPAARELLSHFNFIPYSRLDDLMVSYAPPGGGVGAHFDSYDVFLLQGPGQRRWRVGRQRDLSLVEGAPLKILRNFAPDGECVLSAGDMLYLPPEYAHEGVALDACFTYSIGFRAPSHRELVSRFLAHLDDGLEIDGRYADPDLRAQARPAHIDIGMVAKIEAVLGSITWSRRDVVAFVGGYLTEPASQVVFASPVRALTRTAFSKAVRQAGVELAGGTLMLHSGSEVFINGESHRVDGRNGAPLRELADRRRLQGHRATAAAMDVLYQWYRNGYIYLRKKRRI